MNPDSTAYSRWIKAILAVTLLAFLAGGAWFYRSQSLAMQRQVEVDLTAIARLKANQITDWRKDQINDAGGMQAHPFLPGSVARFLADPNEANREDLLARMRSLAGQHNYADILLVEASGKVLLSVSDNMDSCAAYDQALAEALRRRKPVFTDIHIDRPDASPHTSVVAPLFTGLEHPQKPLGALILVNNASEFLYPLVQYWPTPSETAETLLVRRDGDHVLFLNNVRHQPDSALKLRIPLSRTTLPAVMAVQGLEGFVRGWDYRDVEVASVILPIPESPWFMVAKVDAAEVYAEWRFRSILILVILFGLIALAGAAGMILRQREKKVHYQELFLAESALRASTERHGITLRSIGDAVIATDTRGLIELLNPVAESLTGWTNEEAAGRPLEEIFRIINEETREKMENPVARVLREGLVIGLANHTLLISRDAAERPIADSGAPIRDEAGAITGVVLVFRDQTAERAAQAELRASEERYRHTLDGMMEGCQIIGPDWKYLYINDAAARHGRRTRDELLGRTMMEVYEGIESSPLFAVLQRCLKENTPERLENEFIYTGGSRGYFELSIEPVPEGLFILSVDITQRRRTEERLRHLTDVLRALRNVNQLITREKDRETLLGKICAVLTETRGYRSAWISLHDPAGGLKAAAESGVGDKFLALRADLERGRWPECRRLATNQSGFAVIHHPREECRGCPLDEIYGDTSVLAGILNSDDGGFGLLVVTLPSAAVDSVEEQALFKELCGDISFALSMMEVEMNRQKSEHTLRAIFDSASDGVLLADAESSRFIVGNKAIARMLGCSSQEIIGLSVDDIHRAEDLENVKAQFNRQARGEITLAPNIPVKRQDGSVFLADVNAAAFELDGRPHVLGIFRDITARRSLEDQLRQAQKMEAVGRLAGGVAHDYNNMLSVIIGHAEMAMDKVDPENPLRESLEEILAAARRSAAITRQLLAFARKQTISPQVFDLNQTVEGMLKMLRRLIGEDIDLLWKPGRANWPVKMDPSQFDQLLANLCINARDAIAGVGKVTIETSQVTFDEAYCADHVGFIPGDFILLAVSDDGRGMNKETLDSIFEPFFTTKGSGQGTGLGLATVYGIVKQNNGFINVYSEPDKGTTFRIYLPPHTAEVRIAGKEATAIRSNRGETVLVVEDEKSILKLAVRMLEALGYAVLSAGTTGDALRLAEEHAGDIDLLLTDVVMPGMTGRELGQQLSALYPDIRILFMSGYTADVIAHRGVLDDGVNFIQKPFSRNDLAIKVRAALDDN